MADGTATSLGRPICSYPLHVIDSLSWSAAFPNKLMGDEQSDYEGSDEACHM